MLRTVIDTNVFVSALLQSEIPRRVYSAFLNGRLTPVFSTETLSELLEVLTRPPLRVLLKADEVEGLLALIQRDALLVRPTVRINACRDVKDNVFLECAVAGAAGYLVTGDADLLALDPFQGIRILRPTDFLHRLR